jgi:O-antigen/teichoic acid export membrane protein
MPFFLLLILLPEDVMGLFGASFREGKVALVIIAVGHFVNASTGPVGNVLVMTGHQRIMVLNSIGVFLLNVVSNYLLIPRYGMAGAALASGASIAVYNLAMLAETYYFLHMHPYGRMFLRTTAVGAATGLALRYLVKLCPSRPFLRISVYAPLFLIALFFLLYRTCLTEEDREMMDAIKAKFRLGSATS